jgi:tetratricopeptide (TPR) repeat protein
MKAFESGNIDQAITHLAKGITIDPLAFELQYHLGLLHGRREDHFAAIDALETAVGLLPRHFSALKNLAVVYQRAGFRHKAVETWQRAMANAPDDETRAQIKDHMVTLL